jgi:hypothetical protein
VGSVRDLAAVGGFIGGGWTGDSVNVGWDRGNRLGGKRTERGQGEKEQRRRVEMNDGKLVTQNGWIYTATVTATVTERQ